MARTLAALALLIAAPLFGSVPAAAEPRPRTPGPELQVTGFALRSMRPDVVRRNAGGLARVSVAGVSISDDGRRVVNRPDRAMLRLVDVAHAQGLDAELLVSNYSNRLGGFDALRNRRLLGSAANIERVADQLAGLAAAGGWDGVNVDLELVHRDDADGLVALVEALQEALPEEKTVSIDISAATSVAAYRSRGYDLVGLAGAADTIAVMAYDQHGPTWSGPGPIGALAWQERAMRAALRKVPPAQLDLGVAGYGYTWPERGTGRSVTVQGARKLVERTGARAVWHRDSGEWSARLPGGTVVWWSDAHSYRLRAALARRLGLHGLALWRLDSADRLT